jgi:ATP-dependent helicase/nuclease subunit A
MGIPASDVNAEWPTEELVLVQGIIDAYFEEEGQLVLVDYKTDRVSGPDGNELIVRYQKQLLYYKKALQQITGKKVKETDIYSVRLGRKIEISN